MAEDYYKVLGVPRTATQEEIQKAYLGLARKYHPDMNLDNPEAAKKKFQELQTAFDVLKDPEKREKYNQFGEGFEQYQGFPGGQPGGGFHWSGGGPGAGGTGGFQGGNINLDDILGMFGAGGRGGNPFGGGSNPFESGDENGNPFANFGGTGTTGRTRRRKGPVKGDNYELSVSVPFQTAIRGGKIPLNFRKNDGKIESVEVKIPAGLESGKKIRLRGLGGAGQNGGEAGDLILNTMVEDHPYYTRKGNNLYVKVPITLKEAALGGKADIPTPDGTVSLSIPAGATTGTKLRLRGRGIKEEGQAEGTPGDLFAEFEVQLPKSWSKADQNLIAKLDSELTPPARSSLYF
ncbi:MAG: DnaJ C-terminal domain-containing protein [Planctomycetia bacterium]|nr:DnaJ C-terminal domain-containing protein [Planctomycetia bacterium]